MGISQIAPHITQNQEQMQQWQALLDSAGEGIWGLDLEGRCTFINRMALRTLGFQSREMLGKGLHCLIHHHYPDGRDFPEQECPIYDVLHRNRALHQFTDTMFRRDGTSFIANVSAQPVTVGGMVTGVVVTFRDVTDTRREHDDALRASDAAAQRTAELDAVIESIPHGVYVTTRNAGTRSNRRAREMSGDRFPQELATLDKALQGESSTQTVKVADRWIRSVAAPIFLNGNILGGVAVNTDVTQVRLQDEALRKSEKLAAVGQLASSIAHEINNPLESITNLLYLIRQSESMQDTQQYAKLAQDELARVTEITLQTLRFHRLQSKPAEVDVAELLNAIMVLYTGRLLVRNVAIDLKLDTSPKVFCLEGEIRQVINNLVRNSLDAMSVGGKLQIRLRAQTDWPSGRKGVRITVADTGEGIRPHIKARLFEPFQTTKELTGTGLGLWVSKGIIEKHGGHITVKTRPAEGSHGTAFAVWLPLEGSTNLVPQEC